MVRRVFWGFRGSRCPKGYPKYRPCRAAPSSGANFWPIHQGKYANFQWWNIPFIQPFIQPYSPSKWDKKADQKSYNYISHWFSHLLSLQIRSHHVTLHCFASTSSSDRIASVNYGSILMNAGVIHPGIDPYKTWPGVYAIIYAGNPRWELKLSTPVTVQT